MAYLVKVLRPDDTIASLTIEAADGARAAERARADGCAVLGVTRERIWQSARPRTQRFSTLLFSQELLALLTAGMSLVEALEALKNKREYQGHGLVAALAKSLSEGQPFSVAVARHPEHFRPIYVASMQASERTGNLPDALRRYITYQEQMDAIRRKLVSASIYPALLGAVGMLVMLFLLFYVVPRFSRIYESFSGDLPFFSRLLIDLGRVVSAQELVVAGLLAALIIGAAVLLKVSGLRTLIGRWVRSVPVIAANAHLYELSRLYRTLGMLLRGGVPIVRAMSMAAPLLGLDRQRALQAATRLITEGRPLSSALLEAGLTTSVAYRMLLVGERTGAMGEMMERIGAFHDEDLARWLEGFGRLFEPILMLILGIVIGAIVVVMYMPIFELANVIQ
jgi:general secretion pathway protein F